VSLSHSGVPRKPVVDAASVVESQDQGGHQSRQFETKLKEQLETKLKEQLETKLKEQSEAKLKEHSKKLSEQFQDAVGQLSKSHNVYTVYCTMIMLI